MVRLTIARNRQLSFLVDDKRSEQFDREDGDIDRHIIAVNDIRLIIYDPKLPDEDIGRHIIAVNDVRLIIYDPKLPVSG